MKRDAATLAQVAAADPETSTWLSANAGSGKTRVLTDRVALLLLKGVPPEKILCLTYTKAAASEMQNRLFGRLSSWAMMEDAPLAQNLAQISEDGFHATSETLLEARRLFAKAIETPGGLKIQTIHSFCASLLRRFPLEAQVSPAFVEMDERAKAALIVQVLDEIAETHPTQLSAVAEQFPTDAPEKFAAEIVSKAESFQPTTEANLRADLNLHSNVNEQSILNAVLVGGEAALISRMLPILSTGSERDQALAQGLAAVDFGNASLTMLEALETLFLTGPKTKAPFTPKSNPPTKQTMSALGPDADAYADFRQRVADSRSNRIAFSALRQSIALHEFAEVFLPAYTGAKAQNAWLDFDDLIMRAKALLSNPGVAAWVLFRLDGGIDHILVDEAQDTSPEQWEVIRLLAKEFTSGESARTDIARTVFVVGDQKQSIYSFQGADPDGFSRMRAYFADELGAIGQPLQRRELLHSFRSSEAIMRFVDHTFDGPRKTGMGDKVSHIAFKTKQPGRVDLWPWESTGDKQGDKEWFDPIDLVGTDHHTVQLARKIADFMQDQLVRGQITQDVMRDGQPAQETRAIRPGDFLILVQSRSQLFHEIIRACKDRNLPLAGADRLRMGGELGVKDLKALLSYIATPEDDLSLATILRSPIGGLSEDALFRLAHGRGKKFLRQRLEEERDTHPEIYALLKDLRDKSDFLRPFELLDRALTRYGLRKKLLSRLGEEAEEGIEALLQQALVYEQSQIPNLTGFLSWLAEEDIELKRQMDANPDRIRVMTVHGAKGLEAPIVILPDTGDRNSKTAPDIMKINGRAQRKARSHAMPDVQKTADTERRQRDAEERARLLYVAMTRAESWLVLCGSGKEPRPEKEGWYSAVEDAMRSVGATTLPDTAMLRYANGDWPSEHANLRSSLPQRQPIPSWIVQKPKPPKLPGKSLSPSDMGGAKVCPGDPAESGLPAEEAKARGTAIHLLLEHLPGAPPASWAHIADDLLKHDPRRDDAFDQATALLSNPNLTEIFGQDALSEVAITAELADTKGQRIYGVIDRLIVSDTDVLAIDFKSNRIVPNTPSETPLGLLRQMGAYQAALESIYPDHRIRTAILWTETHDLMELPPDLVRKSLPDTRIDRIL